LAALADSLRAEVGETGVRVLTADAAAAVVAALRLPRTTGIRATARGPA
jgi:hypothetical protein